MSTYKFYHEDGQVDVVSPEKWSWEAHYQDGTVLKQFGDDFKFHQFKEIDQGRLLFFQMVNTVGLPPVTLLFPQGAKLIQFMYRNFCFNFGQPNEIRGKLYCFGYQLGVVKVLFVIMPDNSIMVVDDIEKIKLTV